MNRRDPCIASSTHPERGERLELNWNPLLLAIAAFTLLLLVLQNWA
jgi:hypothetical protein